MNLFWYFIIWTIVYSGIVKMFNPTRQYYEAILAIYIMLTPVVLLIAACSTK